MGFVNEQFPGLRVPICSEMDLPSEYKDPGPREEIFSRDCIHRSTSQEEFLGFHINLKGKRINLLHPRCLNKNLPNLTNSMELSFVKKFRMNWRVTDASDWYHSASNTNFSSETRSMSKYTFLVFV